MPFVSPRPQSDAPEKLQKLLGSLKEKYGKIPNIFATMAHQPDVLLGVVTLNDGLQNDLPATLRELAYFKTSQLNGCAYCSKHHAKAALDAGISQEQLDAIGEYASSSLYSDAEKSVLKYAEELTQKATVSDETVAAVQTHIGETELVTLAATVALANFTNRFNHGLGIELP